MQSPMHGDPSVSKIGFVSPPKASTSTLMCFLQQKNPKPTKNPATNDQPRARTGPSAMSPQPNVSIHLNFPSQSKATFCKPKSFLIHYKPEKIFLVQVPPPKCVCKQKPQVTHRPDGFFFLIPAAQCCLPRTAPRLIGPGGLRSKIKQPGTYFYSSPDPPQQFCSPTGCQRLEILCSEAD